MAKCGRVIDLSLRGEGERMKKFYPFDGKTLYGKRIAEDIVTGLVAEVRHGTMIGRKCSYVVFRDDRGIKWRITPTRLGRTGLPLALRAVPRAELGKRGRGDAATPTGFNNLVHHIRQCEGQGHPDTTAIDDAELIWFEVYESRMELSPTSQGALPFL